MAIKKCSDDEIRDYAMKSKTLDSFLRKSDSAPATEAQRIRAMANPYLSAVARCAYRRVIDSENHLNDKKVFFFEDGSSLAFKVAYTVE